MSKDQELKETKKIPCLDHKEESAVLAQHLSSLATELLKCIKLDFFTSVIHQDVEFYMATFKADPVRLILKINDKMLELQNNKYFQYSVIEPFSTFLEEASQAYSKYFLSNISILKQEIIKLKAVNKEICKKLSILLGEIIQLSSIDCFNCEELIPSGLSELSWLGDSTLKKILKVFIPEKEKYLPHVDKEEFLPAIHFAVGLGLFDILPCLVKSGVDPNEVDSHGETCLGAYIERETFLPEHLEMFLKIGVDFNKRMGINQLTPVEKSIVLNKPISQYFLKNGYHPEWKSELKVSALTSLYEKIELYILKKYSQRGKKNLVIIVGEFHRYLSSQIINIMVINICYRLGIKYYCIEQSHLNESSADVPMNFFKLFLPVSIAKKYGMKLIAIDTAGLINAYNIREDMLDIRNRTMASNIIKIGRSSLAVVGASHLESINKFLKLAGFETCLINAGDLISEGKPSPYLYGEEKFLYDESKCMQAYLPKNVNSSEEIMLLMQTVYKLSTTAPEKIAPMLVEKGIFRTPTFSADKLKNFQKEFQENERKVAATSI